MEEKSSEEEVLTCSSVLALTKRFAIEEECFATTQLKLRNTVASGSLQRRNMLATAKQFATMKERIRRSKAKQTNMKPWVCRCK